MTRDGFRERRLGTSEHDPDGDGLAHGRWFDARAVVQHAFTIWVGQIAVMAFAIADSFILGRYAPDALAALSVGTAIYISLYIGLQGFIQTLLPIWAHLHGAGRAHALGASVRQSLYVTAACAALGLLALWLSPHVLAWAQVPSALQPQVREYLRIQALTLPMALLLRNFNTFSQSIGCPQWVTRLQTAALAVKVPLSIWLAFGGLGVPALGLAGCAWATCITHAVLVLAAAWLVRNGKAYAPYQVWQPVERMHGPTLREFLRLGIPGSLAIWVEVTSFTAMSLLIAPFGTTAAAAQQIASNTAAVLYMWPLSLAIATSARISYWRGALRQVLARAALRTGLQIAVCSAVLVAVWVGIASGSIAGWYARQPEIVQLAASLLPLVALYHVADACQTMALFALRCFHVVRTPTVVYTVLLWGMGLGGGYWLAHAGHWPYAAGWQGAQAFWVAAASALALVAVLLLWLLRWVVKRPQ